jgi:ABC-type amino acid transport substrate-binding protein
MIADNLMLFYQHLVHFFVGKHRPELAKALKKGLAIALQDGSYKALFQSYYANTLERANSDTS